jgi:hypothetical protein
VPDETNQQPVQPSIHPQPDAAQPAPAPLPTPIATPYSQPMPQTFEPQPSVSSAPYVQAVPAMMPASKKSRLPLILALVGGGIVLLLIVGGIITYIVIASSAISPANIQSAETAAHALSNDINTIFDTADKMSSETSQTQVSADAKTISSTLADAQKQYLTLKSSKIQRNASVSSAFGDFSTKWPPFTAYMAGSVSDVQTLAPALFNFEIQINTLDQNQPSTTSELGTYLTGYKSIIDTTSKS